MKKWNNNLKNNHGNVLILSYLLVAVLVGLGSAFAILATSELRTADRQLLTAKAFAIAEAGIERSLYDMKEDYENDLIAPIWADGDINGFSIEPGPNVDGYYDVIYEYNLATPAVSIPVSFNEGNYMVSILNMEGIEEAWVQSVGTVGDVTQTIRLYVKIVDVSPWDNAIFAGAGASGAMVNGNVDVRGSVHILGTGLAPGDNAIDLGGTAEFVGNNYNGLSASLLAKVPALPTTTYNSEVVSTLEAELRVKNGLVGLSGSSTVGETDVTGNSVKEVVDAVYVTDGYNGNQGAASVYSDNGTTNAYDLGDSVVFPSLSDTSPDNPARTIQEHFYDNALRLETELNSITPLSTITQPPTANITCSNVTNCIRMDGSGNLLIKGRVYINSGNDLNMSKAGADTTITYSGTGSLLVTGDVQIDVNLVTSGAASFPNNIMGIMTPNTIGFNSAGIDVMGIFYAEDEVIVSKQTNVMGTVAANFFDVGTNVPAIYQVPETMNNLPSGMIGANATSYIVALWKKF
ncbi:MAG: hypothetical protein ACI9E5_000441 [Candidatus Omnitrophota bacterium]|jgi:hypothetical protein